MYTVQTYEKYYDSDLTEPLNSTFSGMDSFAENRRFDRPLSTSYCMEMEMDAVYSHDDKQEDYLHPEGSRRRKQLLFSLAVVGAVLVGATFHFESRRQDPESTGRATLAITTASISEREVPPSLPKYIEITCGAPNVKTLAGAQACEKLCSAARCCTETCFADNREICMQYHESCQILDGVAATGGYHELPKDFEGGWFEMDHFLTSIRGKKVLSVDSVQTNNQLKREEACEGYTTRHGLKECVRLCNPAGCCFTQNHRDADFCNSPNGEDVDCRHYHDCNVLYHSKAP